MSQATNILTLLIANLLIKYLTCRRLKNRNFPNFLHEIKKIVVNETEKHPRAYAKSVLINEIFC